MRGRDGSLAVQGRFDLDLGRGEGFGDRTAVFRKRNLFAEDPGIQAGDLGCGLELWPIVSDRGRRTLQWVVDAAQYGGLSKSKAGCFDAACQAALPDEEHDARRNR